MKSSHTFSLIGMFVWLFVHVCLVRSLSFFFMQLKTNKLIWQKPLEGQRQGITNILINFNLFVFGLPKKDERLPHIPWQTRRTNLHLLYHFSVSIHSFIQPSFIISPKLFYVVKYYILHSMCFLFFSCEASLNS